MKKHTGIVFAALAALLPTSYASAQAVANTVPTNLPGITTSIAAPEGFSPLLASDEELAMYGFPPRPDAQTQPKAFAAWQKAMLVARTRVTPQLELTDIIHHPHQATQKTAAEAGTANSWNWSGSVDFGGASSYNKSSSFYYIIGEWVVPVAKQAFGTCTGGWDWEFSWIGIDGWGSGDVLQAGTESDAYCSGGSNSAYYSAWYEWFGYPETRIPSLPVTAGDDMYVEVWNTSATQGYAFLENMNNNQYVEIGFNPPSGTSLVGNSAEWIVERPGVGGGLSTLTNYISEYFSEAYAYTWAGTQYVPGSAGALQVTMLNNSGSPISYPTLLGNTAIWLQDEGSAR